LASLRLRGVRSSKSICWRARGRAELVEDGAAGMR
jgi:hypothetical protein